MSGACEGIFLRGSFKTWGVLHPALGHNILWYDLRITNSINGQPEGGLNAHNAPDSYRLAPPSFDMPPTQSTRKHDDGDSSWLKIELPKKRIINDYKHTSGGYRKWWLSGRAAGVLRYVFGSLRRGDVKSFRNNVIALTPPVGNPPFPRIARRVNGGGSVSR